MWNEQKIERITREKLIEELGDEPGQERFALYVSARAALVEQILPQINAVMPDHTDHGPEHIANVLENAERLLELEDNPEGLSGMDIYCLILSILFHDAGNIFGRQGHQRKIAEIYDFARAKAQQDRQEKFIVLKATEAHCGEAPDGTRDTLQHLSEQPIQLNRKPVQLRQIAAILRFADELAEGPQRTSLFMQLYHGYSERDEIFHKYASITDVFIDRGNERIALTYNIDIDTSDSDVLSGESGEDLREILDFTQKRISKLNQERKYARHYCDLLLPFKNITVTFNFWISGQPFEVKLPLITDLVVPGDKEKPLSDYHEDYKLDNIIGKVRTYLGESSK